MLLGVGRSVPVNTGANSWATSIAATPERPGPGPTIQVGLHDLGVGLAEPHDRDVIWPHWTIASNAVAIEGAARAGAFVGDWAGI